MCVSSADLLVWKTSEIKDSKINIFFLSVISEVDDRLQFLDEMKMYNRDAEYEDIITSEIVRKVSELSEYQ